MTDFNMTTGEESELVSQGNPSAGAQAAAPPPAAAQQAQAGQQPEEDEPPPPEPVGEHIIVTIPTG